MSATALSVGVARRKPVITIDRVRPFISIGLLLIVWEAASRFGLINSFLFPAPTQIAAAIWREAGPNGNPPYSMLWHVLRSLMRILAGVGLALIFGTIIGFAIGLTKWGRAIFMPIISCLMPVPTLAWTPILLLIFGIDDRTTITVVFIAAAFSIIYNVVAGLQYLSNRLLWAVQSMGASWPKIFVMVIVPGILPYLLTGLRLGIGFAWRSLIAAEMLAASSFGLGFMIYKAAEYMTMPVIYGGIVMIAALGYLLERVVVTSIEKNTVGKWGVQVER